MNNIRFIYLYRDGANFQSWGNVIFSNPQNDSQVHVQEQLEKYFLTDNLFIASQVRIPEVFLFANEKITAQDHCFHEFRSVEICAETVTDEFNRSITDFLREVKNASIHGWKAFDILEHI